jgi:hypothetical protein
MAHETTIAPKSSWQKLLIYWRTKNLSTEVYDIALILAVAIFTNKKIYEEELEEAKMQLQKRLRDAGAVDEVMQYIEMKLACYAHSIETWHKDQQRVRELIEKDEELYGYLLSIFEADALIDDEESGFETSLKKALLRS